MALFFTFSLSQNCEKKCGWLRAVEVLDKKLPFWKHIFTAFWR